MKLLTLLSFVFGVIYTGVIKLTTFVIYSWVLVFTGMFLWDLVSRPAKRAWGSTFGYGRRLFTFGKDRAAA